MEFRPRIDQDVLVLAAHADDEILGALTWLLQCQGALTVAFLTDGTPSPAWRPKTIAAAEYRALRRNEAQNVWHDLRPDARLVFAPFADQTLAFRLRQASEWLHSITTHSHPSLMLAPAFEGGHPDHDACNLLGSVTAVEFGLQAWEYALYTARSGVVRKQEFPQDPRWTHLLNEPSLALRQSALAAYRSQAATLAELSAPQEAMRPLPQHDYRRPALTEPAVYERWGFPVTAEQVARECVAFLASRTRACVS